MIFIPDLLLVRKDNARLKRLRKFLLKFQETRFIVNSAVFNFDKKYVNFILRFNSTENGTYFNFDLDINQDISKNIVKERYKKI
jgi:hypothetical protein